MYEAELKRMAGEIAALRREINGRSKNERPRGVFNPYNLLGSAIGLHLALPKVRGFWSLGSMDNNRAIKDLTGHGNHMTAGNAPLLARSRPYVYLRFNGTNQYYTLASNATLTITDRVTVGGWWWLSNFGAGSGLLGINEMYWLELSGGAPRMNIYNAGSTYGSPMPPPLNMGQWYWIAGRFESGTDISTVVGNPKDGTISVMESTTSVPASITSNANPLELARKGAGSYFYGYSALPFLCADRLTDREAEDVFNATKSLFI